MTRIVNINAPDTNSRSLTALLSTLALPAGSIFPKNLSYLSISVGGSSQTLNVGTLNNSVDGFIPLLTASAPLVIQSFESPISTDEIIVKAGAAAAPILLIMVSTS